MDMEKVKESSNDSDLLEIVCRSKTYRVSKKLLCSSIPYFEKMFCCDLLESKTNKVTLDFDVKAFNNVLNFVYSNILFLKMDNVLQTYDCCEYLMIDAPKKKCSEFFFENFNISHLPLILASINDISKLITPQILRCFISRHFLTISSTKTFESFPLDTIEYIFSLDLVIDSEYQVYQAIKRWVQYENGRDRHLTQLLKSIRWCHVDAETLNKIKCDDLFRGKVQFNALVCPFGISDCGPNRVNINTPLMIHQMNPSTISIVLLKDLNEGICLPCGQFILGIVSSDFITDEHVTDIFYDSGRKCIRVDWASKTFNHLDLSVSSTYNNQIKKYIKFSSSDHLNVDVTTSKDQQYQQNSNGMWDESFHSHRNSRQDPIRNGRDSVKADPLRYHSCVIKDKTYKIHFNGDMYVEGPEKTFLLRHEPKEFPFEDLILFSYQNDLFLYKKATQKMARYDKSNKKWSTFVEIQSSQPLVTISTTYAPTRYMKTLFTVQ